MRRRAPGGHSVGVNFLRGCAEGVLTRVFHVKEAILVLVLGVQVRHLSGIRWDRFADKEKDCLLRLQHDALANNEDKLADGKVRGNEELVFIKVRDVAILYLFADDGKSVWVALAHLVCLTLAVLEGVSGLVLALKLLVCHCVVLWFLFVFVVEVLERRSL
jgi:hypothetical protein